MFELLKKYQKMNSFKGGIHPKEYKELTENLPFEFLPIPKQIILPLQQHLGKQAIPIVKKGDEVKTGKLIANIDGIISAPIHSSVCGKVLSIGKETNASGFPKDSIVISTNENNEKEFLTPLNPDLISKEEIIERIKNAGIVGQGGAAFPTYVKLSPPKEKIIDTVILNACECEPYLTRDYRFILEKTDEMIGGLKLIMKALNVKNGFIGIEDNKPKAIEKIKEAIKNETDITLVVLKTKYPQGAEKMLIKAVDGREVPPGKIPIDVGVIVQNVGTAISIFDAVIKGQPSITSAITVSGKGIKNPKNLIVPIGTSIKDIIDYCGGFTDDAARIIVGGPMMGIAQYDLFSPIMKATSGLLVLTKKEINEFEETDCVKCGKCISVCPINLMPTRLVRLIQLGKYEEAEKLGITVCMECGTCAFTCPAGIPLVQWLRLGKQKVNQLQKAKIISLN